MTVSEAEEKAGLGFKRFGVTDDRRVAGVRIDNAAGDLVAFFAAGETESSPLPVLPAAV